MDIMYVTVIHFFPIHLVVFFHTKRVLGILTAPWKMYLVSNAVIDEVAHHPYIVPCK